MATAVIIKENNSVASKIKPSRTGYSSVKQILPFRVKFSNITIPGYGPNSPAPIGIAVIGFNNYIL